MSGSFVLFSRLSVGICAAVILIAMCSHAARASPAVPIIQKTEEYSILRRINPEQQVPSLAGQLGKEQQVQTPADTLFISSHQSYPVHFTQGSFTYSQNSLDKTWPRVKITKLQRGGMMRPASSTFTTNSPYKGPEFDESRIPDDGLPQKDENAENKYNSNTDWIKYLKKPGSEGGIPKTTFSKVDEDKSERKVNFVFPSQTGRLQRTQLLTQRGLGSGFLEMDQLPTVRVQSDASRMPLQSVFDFTNQAWGGARSLRNSLSVIKRNSNQEKPTSISKLPQNQNSVSSREMPEHNDIQTYLFKESPAQIYTMKNVGQKAFRGQRNTANWAQKQSLSGTQEKNRFISNLNHFTRTDPYKEESEAQIVFGRRQAIFCPTPHKAAAPTPGFLHPVSEDRNLQNLVSAVHSQDGRRAFVVLDRVDVPSREPRQEFTAGQSVKSFHCLDGLINPERKPVKETSGPSSADKTQSTLDKGVDIGFKFSNPYPSLSQKYSFGQKRVVATTTTPAKQGTVQMSPPSPVAQLSSTTTVQPFTSMLKSQQPETGASMNRHENGFRPYKGKFGLEGYGGQPLEGAKALPQSTDSPVKSKPSFKVFELRSSEVSRPKPIRIYRLYNQRDDKEPGSSGDFKMPPKFSRAAGSVSFASNKAHILHGFLPSKNQTMGTRSRTSWKYPARISPMVSSSNFSSLDQSADELKPKAADGNKPAAEEVPEFRTLTSRTVRGKRVRLTQTGSRSFLRPIAINATGNSVIRRQPRVKAVTYEDVPGSASFSSVRSPGQDRFPNMTTVQGEGWSSKSDDVKNVSGSPKANVTNEETESVYRKERADSAVETSDLFFESEGSGSLDLSDVLSSASENGPAGNDLLELDYLRKSTGNVSFKSVSESHLEQQ